MHFAPTRPAPRTAMADPHGPPLASLLVADASPHLDPAVAVARVAGTLGEEADATICTESPDGVYVALTAEAGSNGKAIMFLVHTESLERARVSPIGGGNEVIDVALDDYGFGYYYVDEMGPYWAADLFKCQLVENQIDPTDRRLQFRTESGKLVRYEVETIRSESRIGVEKFVLTVAGLQEEVCFDYCAYGHGRPQFVYPASHPGCPG